jgi:site-specific recombinase XerC
VPATGSPWNRPRALIRQPDTTLKGSRDRAILMLLVGCGVRRAELVSLTVTHLQPREGRWVLLDVIGKGGRIRTIPVPAWAYTALAEWLRQSGITEGLLFRSIARGEMGRAISTQAVADMVHDYSAAIGHPVAPHDLRRTYAKLRPCIRWRTGADPSVPWPLQHRDDGVVPGHSPGFTNCAR